MSQQQFQQLGQQTQQAFDQYVPESVSQAVFKLEQLETDAEWAHGQAMKMGDVQTASKLADVSQIAHLQKNLLLRQSMLSQTMGQCTQQSFQQYSQQLQQSQTPGVQHVTQLLQQVSQSITQASSEIVQSGQSTTQSTQSPGTSSQQAGTGQPQSASSQSQMGGQSGQGGIGGQSL